jgi:2-amino-4-hydroxy-6-hydroxymethyldihydropteridine diphosphokinase
MGDRVDNLSRARTMIGDQCGKLLQASSLYETEAWGMKDQAPFLNQALAIETRLAPAELLDSILSIEEALGRVRQEKYGPRTIDIDILFFGEQVIDQAHLSIPHPFLHERRFALVCMDEIAPELVHPVSNKTIRQLLQDCPDASMVNKL